MADLDDLELNIDETCILYVEGRTTREKGWNHHGKGTVRGTLIRTRAGTGLTNDGQGIKRKDPG